MSKLNEEETRNKIADAVGTVSIMQAMGMNRHERRRLARINGLPKIAGSAKPVVK